MLYFGNIKEVRLTNEVLNVTKQRLNEAGKRKDESFVLWAGKFKTDFIFYVDTVIYPEQNAFRTSSGIGVYVSGDELFKINKWLYDNKQVLISQVHSHPTNAYHSDTDNNFPLVTEIGQFSIVVPYFARVSIALPNCAVYRLNSSNRWIEVNKSQISIIFKVVG